VRKLAEKSNTSIVKCSLSTPTYVTRTLLRGLVFAVQSGALRKGYLLGGDVLMHGAAATASTGMV